MLHRSLLMYSSFSYSCGMEEKDYSGIFLEFLSILYGPVWLICSCWKIHQLCPPPIFSFWLLWIPAISLSFTWGFCCHEGFYREADTFTTQGRSEKQKSLLGSFYHVCVVARALPRTKSSVIKCETALLTSPFLCKSFNAMPLDSATHSTHGKHRMSWPALCCCKLHKFIVFLLSHARKDAITLITYSHSDVSINILKPLNTALNSVMYIQKAWEPGEQIPDVRDCKLKRFSPCPCSRSSIAKQLMLLQQQDRRLWLQHIFQAHRSHFLTACVPAVALCIPAAV